MGELNFFKLNYWHLVSGGFWGASNAFCSKLEKTCWQQLHHSRAGSPSELLCKLSGAARMQGVSPAGTDLWYASNINSALLHGRAEPSSCALCTCRVITQLHSRRTPLKHWCNARTRSPIYAQMLRSRGFLARKMRVLLAPKLVSILRSFTLPQQMAGADRAI